MIRLYVCTLSLLLNVVVWHRISFVRGITVVLKIDVCVKASVDNTLQAFVELVILKHDRPRYSCESKKYQWFHPINEVQIRSRFCFGVLKDWLIYI